MERMRTLGTLMLSLMVIGASLLFLMFSTCAFTGVPGGGKGAFIVGAIVALAVIVGGVYGLKRINQRNVE